MTKRNFRYNKPVEIPVLFISSGLFHPSLLARRAVERFLRGLPDYRFQHTASLEMLPRLDLSAFRGLVLYFHHKTISPAALDTFEKYVQSGGGVLAIHSASASFKQSQRYHDLLGGRFIRHGPIEDINLLPGSASALFDGIAPFTIHDELYRHAYDATNTVHFFVEAGGEREPFVWSRTSGTGRVLYIAPGHTVSAVQHPQVREILRRGLAWACGRAGE